MQSVLVTGGGGFIGGHLAERLADMGCYVVVVDDLRNNPQVPSVLRTRDNILFIQMSLEDYADHNAHRNLFDVVYHLASPVGPAGILPYRGEMIRQIVNDAYDAIALTGTGRLVYVSTSEIYGGGINGLCHEDTPRIIAPTTTARLEYAIGKLAGETAVLNTPDLDAVIIRPFNVCGPRQQSSGGFVLPRFIEQATSGSPLTVFGDGSQVRAFTHVADIVDGLILAAEKGQAKQSYNLGNPANKTTISELAYRVIKSAHADPCRVRYLDGKEVFGPHYAEAADKYPDATRAMQELGWNPSRGIDDTVQDCLKERYEHVS